MPVNYQLAQETYLRYAQARDSGHLDYVKKADKCEEYFRGVQWDPITKRQLEAQGKPVLTINKVLATIAAVMGEQLNNRADISFRPLRDGTQEVSDALTKVYAQITNENKLDWLESEVAADGFITGRGFYDIRASFDDHMQGEVDIRRLNPRNVLIDPDAEDYDPDTWKEVFVTKWMTIDDIAQLYNEADAKYLGAKGSSEFKYGYDSIERFHGSFGGNAYPIESPYDIDNLRRRYRVIERQHKKWRNAWHFVDIATGDIRPIPDTWTKARREVVAKEYDLGLVRKMVEQIRWTVTCDDVVLFDEWSPYLHFSVMPYFPYLRNGRTIGLVENLISPQDQLNKTSSQELHIINTTANSGWKVKTGALQNMDIEDLEQRGAETGVVFELDDIGNMEKLTPNQVPTGLDRVSYKSDEYIKEISGVSDSSRGFDRADVAAKAIQAKKAAGSVNLAKPMDNLNRTRHLLAVRVLDIVQEYYTEERLVNITGGGLNDSSEQMQVNQTTPEGTIVNDLTIGEYDVVVTTVPARANFEETQFQEALELRQLGIQIPDAVLVENSHLSRKAEIAAEIKAANGGGEKSEEDQQIAKIELQLKQLEVAEMQAKNKETEAKAASALVAAKKDAFEMEKPPAQDNTVAIERAKLQLERAKMQAEIKLKRDELVATLQLKREELDAKIELNKQEAAAKAKLAHNEAIVETKSEEGSEK